MGLCKFGKLVVSGDARGWCITAGLAISVTLRSAANKLASDSQ